jgi:hypothetical protein
MQADQNLQVFRLVSDYLPLNDALNLLCLNTYFYEHLPNSLFKRIIVQQAIPILFDNEQHQESLDQILSSLNLTGRSYDLIYESLRSAKNLVKNPYGARGFENWSRHNGGNGWAIENWGTYRGRSHAFVSSFNWGELHQRIQLPGNKNRFLVAKSMIARRWDCGGKGQIVVEFDNSTKLSSDTLICPYDERDTGTSIEYGWVAISVKCKVPDEVKSVNLILRGSDTQFWAGHYGARFGMTSLRVLIIDDEEHTSNSIRRFKGVSNQATIPDASIKKVRDI